MKVNEAPEKLYLHSDLSHPAGKRYLNLNKVSDKDIEYVRKDAFIEKACEWLKDNIYQRVYKQGDSLGFPTAEFLEQFKKAMKGE